MQQTTKDIGSGSASQAKYRRALRPPVGPNDILESINDDSILDVQKHQTKSDSHPLSFSSSFVSEGHKHVTPTSHHGRQFLASPTAHDEEEATSNENIKSSLQQHHFFSQYEGLCNEREKALLTRSVELIHNVDETNVTAAVGGRRYGRGARRRTGSDFESPSRSPNRLSISHHEPMRQDQVSDQMQASAQTNNTFADEAAAIAAQVSLSSSTLPYRTIRHEHSRSAVGGSSEDSAPPRAAVTEQHDDIDEKEHNQLLDLYFNFQAMQRKRQNL